MSRGTSRGALQRWLRVTRVARLTGLDRTSVEVAAAVRPDGHVLQVTNGKGESFEEASASALSEAAELHAAERADPARLQWGTATELRHTAGRDAVWSLESLGSAGEPDVTELPLSQLRCAWQRCPQLSTGPPVWVPAQALYCHAEDGVPLGPQAIRWTTNGMGARPGREGAVIHALFEAVERDQLARSLPEGWTASAVARRRLALEPTAAPRAWRWERRLDDRGFDVFWFDLTPAPSRGGLGLPVAGVLLWDRERGPIPLTAGYASAATPEQALLAALREAAQSRLTDVHGAREDVMSVNRADANRLFSWCREARPSGHASLSRMPSLTARPGARALVTRLRRRGHSRVALATLTSDDAPLHVVKVVIPSFRVSALL